MKCKMTVVFVLRASMYLNNSNTYRYAIVEPIDDFSVRISQLNINHAIGWPFPINKKLTKKFLHKDTILKRCFVDAYKDIINDIDPEIILKAAFPGETVKVIMKYKIKT